MAKKTLYNFYLDDEVKKKCVEKLERLNGKQEKGQLSALIRVLLSRFAQVKDENESRDLLDAVALEYEITLRSNKRSKL